MRACCILAVTDAGTLEALEKPNVLKRAEDQEQFAARIVLAHNCVSDDQNLEARRQGVRRKGGRRAA